MLIGMRRWARAVSNLAQGGKVAGQPVLYVEGHMQPFGLYRHLWENRNRPEVPASRPDTPQKRTDPLLFEEGLCRCNSAGTLSYQPTTAG